MALGFNTVGQDVGDTRLLALADVLDQTTNYNQGDGTICAYGHYRHYISDCVSLENEFHLDQHEVVEIFGSNGCNDARRDGKKAAAYIRDFVARRNKEVENEGLLGGGESAKQDACVTV